MDRDALLHDLTLVMLYLTSWEVKSVDGPVRRAWKSYDWDVIDRLTEEGLIDTSHRAKSVYLSAEACERVEGMLAALESAAGTAEGAATEVPVRAFKFRVSLRLWKGHPCWREIVVPATDTFADLHDAIQSAFLWWDYHWSHFELRMGGENVQVMDAFEIEESERWDTAPPRVRRIDSAELRLDEVFPRTRTARYDYDYGDGWEHDIKFVEAIDGYVGELPVCTAGAGDAPPEDVGGVGGFEDFLRVTEDPSDPEHDEMVGWGWGQFYEPFDLRSVNRRMRMWKTDELVREWEERNG